jgi:predicted membrane chloride channel (bestrophin family)
MLVYETQKWGGFAVLWRVFCKGDLAGSVFPAVMPWACVAASIAGLIKLDAAMEWSMFSSVHDDSLFDATYALQVWATAVGFALVFRSNLAYGRFWEGRGQIAKFSSYMQDTALMAVTYDEANKNMNQYREWKQVHL